LQSITVIEGSDNHVGELANIGIITTSDRASAGQYEDQGGPAILGFFEEAIKSPINVHYRCISDDQQVIEQSIKELVDEIGCCVVVTTGGTGPAERDVTPEATAAVCDRILDGFGEQMRAISLNFVPTAILSRQIGGTRGSCLIFNLPGRPKAIRETIDEIWRAVPYCIDLMKGPFIDMNLEICNAFRPKSK
jgi:molybdopterin adenylyltransferase